MPLTNEEDWFKYDDTIAENAGNVVVGNDVLKINQSMDVRVPKSDANDFTFAVRVSSIRKVYKACDEVRKTNFSLAELWLSLSTLFGGAFISAMISQIKYEFNVLSILFYSICPLLAGVFLVLYFMFRNNSVKTATALADVILENIPDPEEKEENA